MRIIFILFMFVAFANERRYLRILQHHRPAEADG